MRPHRVLVVSAFLVCGLVLAQEMAGQPVVPSLFPMPPKPETAGEALRAFDPSPRMVPYSCPLKRDSFCKAVEKAGTVVSAPNGTLHFEVEEWIPPKTKPKPQDEFAQSDVDPETEERMRKSNPLLAMKFNPWAHVAQAFPKFVSPTSELLNDCCRQDKMCRKIFLQTTWVQDESIRTAHYDQQFLHQIHISSSSIGGCLTGDCVDDLLLHELGHACEYSIVHANPRRGYRHPYFGYGLSPMVYADVLGPKAASCILAAVHFSSYEEWLNESNPLYWARLTEGFADSVFAHRRKNLRAFQSYCYKNNDRQHEDKTAVLDCVLAFSPAVSQQFCSYDGALRYSVPSPRPSDNYGY